MSTITATADKFSENFQRIQQQFKEMKPLEQMKTIVELSRTFEITYQHFLLHWFQVNILMERNPMFEHTVDDANSPGTKIKTSCLLDSIFFLFQQILSIVS